MRAGGGGGGEVGGSAADAQGCWADGAHAGGSGGEFVADAGEFVLEEVLRDAQGGLLVLQAVAEFLGGLHAQLLGVRWQLERSDNAADRV